MKKPANEIVSALRAIIGENTSDEAIQIIEDITDSVNDDDAEWKQKYEENDKNWRERYMARFMNPEPMPVTTPQEIVEDNENDLQGELESTEIDDLFEKREG